MCLIWLLLLLLLRATMTITFDAEPGVADHLEKLCRTMNLGAGELINMFIESPLSQIIEDHDTGLLQGFIYPLFSIPKKKHSILSPVTSVLFLRTSLDAAIPTPSQGAHATALGKSYLRVPTLGTKEKRGNNERANRSHHRLAA